MKGIGNVGALQLFHVLRFATLILIGIILVKSGYSTKEIGAYELFFFISNVLSFFWLMGFNNGLMSYFPSLSKDKGDVLLFNVGVLLVCVALITCMGFLLLKEEIAFWLNQENGIEYITLLLAYLFLSASGNFTEYYYLLKDRSKWIIRYGIFLFGIQLCLIGLGILMQFSVEGLLKLMVVWAGIKFIWYWTLVWRYGKWKLDLRLQWAFLLFCLPLMIQMLLGNGMEYVDGFLINYFFDESVFAQFRYGARELPLVTVLVGAISTALIPQAVNSMTATIEELNRRMTQLAAFLFPLSILLMLSADYLFVTFYSTEFVLSATFFKIYLLIISSRILMPQVILFARQNNLILMASAFVELVVNVLLSLWLLKIMGVVGIAWATVIAYLVNKIILMFFSWSKHKISPSAYLNLRQYFLWLSLLILSYYLSNLY